MEHAGLMPGSVAAIQPLHPEHAAGQRGQPGSSAKQPFDINEPQRLALQTHASTPHLPVAPDVHKNGITAGPQLSQLLWGVDGIHVLKVQPGVALRSLRKPDGRCQL